MIQILLAALLGQSEPTHRVHIRDGGVLEGRLIRQDADEIVLSRRPGEELAVSRARVERVEELRNEAAETRRAVDMLLAVHAAAHPDTRRPLGRRLHALGPEALAYAAALLRRPGRLPIEGAELVEAIAAVDGSGVEAALREAAAGAADPFARVAALAALARRGTSEAVRAVLAGLDDPSHGVRQAAVVEAVSLLRKGSAKAEDVVALLGRAKAKDACARVLARAGGEAGREALEERLREGTSRERIETLEALSETRRPRTDAELGTELLGDEDREVRKKACVYVGRIRWHPAVPVLTAMLEDEDEAVAEHALWALRRISGLSYARDPELWARWWAKAGRLP